MDKQANDDNTNGEKDNGSGRDDVIVKDEDDAEQTASSSEDLAEEQGSQEMIKIKQDFEALQAQSADLQNQLKRALADYQNLERRVTEGRDEIAHWATGGVISKMLPILDNLEKALEGASEEEKGSAWFRGVALAVKQFQDVLKSEGLEELKAEGEFDPVKHEAVDTRDGKENHILEVVQKGYNLNGKVLRPARVVVGRKG
jgi:molecular chaperone GrpE